jgi:hypothetical protein
MRPWFALREFPVTICRIDLSMSRTLMNTAIQTHPGLRGYEK